MPSFDLKTAISNVSNRMNYCEHVRIENKQSESLNDHWKRKDVQQQQQQQHTSPTWSCGENKILWRGTHFLFVNAKTLKNTGLLKYRFDFMFSVRKSDPSDRGAEGKAPRLMKHFRSKMCHARRFCSTTSGWQGTGRGGRTSTKRNNDTLWRHWMENRKSTGNGVNVVQGSWL